MGLSFLQGRLILVVGFAGLIGCGGSPKYHPVVGTVLVDGQPVANVMVALHPVNVGERQAGRPVAVTGPDGEFQVMSAAPNDGAPAGDYVITAVWPDRTIPQDECLEAAAHDRFQGRYGNPMNSPWRVTVRPGYNEVTLRASLPVGGWLLPRLRDGAQPAR